MAAAANGHLSIVEYLVQQAAQNNEKLNIFGATDVCGQTALHLAHALWMHENTRTEIVALLLKAGVNANIKMNNNTESLSIHIATIRNYLGSVKAHIEHDPTLLNQPDHFGYTPLMRALEQRSLQLVEYLLTLKDLDVNCKTHGLKYFDHGDVDVNGKTALHLAAEAGSNEIVLQLLRMNPKIDPAKPIIKRFLSEEAKQALEQYEEKVNQSLEQCEEKAKQALKQSERKKKPDTLSFFSSGQTPAHQQTLENAAMQNNINIVGDKDTGDAQVTISADRKFGP